MTLEWMLLFRCLVMILKIIKGKDVTHFDADQLIKVVEEQYQR